MEELYFLGQLLFAVLLGAVVGWQRGNRGKAAGPRTYALVTAGAALFTILSLTAFSFNENSRVASQIVTGIGFLGAGIIFRRENHIEGLTTAAGLWMAAAVGMAVGARYFVLAGGATVMMFVLLAVNDRKFRKNHAVANNGSDQ